MAVVSILAGAVMVVAVTVDMGVTVLAPTARGPIAHRLTRAVWQLARAAVRTTGTRRALACAGPGGTFALFVFWLTGLWLGFALIYLPELSHFMTSAHVPRHGFVSALYVSGTMLTTLGLGDALPGAGALRLVVVGEAATGAAGVSAMISYILSVYPLATQTRVRALRAADLSFGDPDAAYAYLAAGGDSAIGELHSELIEGHQNLRRFPMLYYFHPGRDSESVGTLLDGAVVVCAVARWAPPPELSVSGRRAARGLELALERITEDYLDRYIDGRAGRPSAKAPDESAAARALTAFAARVGADPRPGFARELACFAARMGQLLDGLAAAHCTRSQPLLGRLAGDRQASSVLRSASRAV